MSRARRWVLHLVLASCAGLSCSSVENPPVSAGSGGGGAAGQGGGAGGRDTSCIDGSDYCVWSCAAGAEMGTGDSPYPYCDAAGAFQCPTGSQRLSTCAPGSCARFDNPLCCSLTTGTVAPAPCNAAGLRDACPAGTSPGADPCIPTGLGVSSCAQLDRTSCTSVDLKCREGALTCDCEEQTGGGLVWWCGVHIR
jgi:hypothetical protein